MSNAKHQSKLPAIFKRKERTRNECLTVKDDDVEYSPVSGNGTTASNAGGVSSGGSVQDKASAVNSVARPSSEETIHEPALLAVGPSSGLGRDAAKGCADDEGKRDTRVEMNPQVFRDAMVQLAISNLAAKLHNVAWKSAIECCADKRTVVATKGLSMTERYVQANYVKALKFLKPFFLKDGINQEVLDTITPYPNICQYYKQDWSLYLAAMDYEDIDEAGSDADAMSSDSSSGDDEQFRNKGEPIEPFVKASSLLKPSENSCNSSGKLRAKAKTAKELNHLFNDSGPSSAGVKIMEKYPSRNVRHYKPTGIKRQRETEMAREEEMCDSDELISDDDEESRCAFIDDMAREVDDLEEGEFECVED